MRCRRPLPLPFLACALLCLPRPAEAAWLRCPDWIAAAGSALLSTVRPTMDARAIAVALMQRYPDWEKIGPHFARLDRPSKLSLMPLVVAAAYRDEDNAAKAAQLLAANVPPPDLANVATETLSAAATVTDTDRWRAVAIFYVQLLNAPSAIYLIDQAASEERSSLDRRRLLLLLVTVTLARATPEPVPHCRLLEVDGNEDLGALLRWLDAKASGAPATMAVTATGALAEALPHLPAAARLTLYRWTETHVDPKVVASILPKQLLEESDAAAWEAGFGAYVNALEAIAADDAQRLVFAPSAGFRFIEGAPWDLRSRAVRTQQGFLDMQYDTVAASPPYMVRYNARLERVEKARAIIAAARP